MLDGRFPGKRLPILEGPADDLGAAVAGPAEKIHSASISIVAIAVNAAATSSLSLTRGLSLAPQAGLEPATLPLLSLAKYGDSLENHASAPVPAIRGLARISPRLRNSWPAPELPCATPQSSQSFWKDGARRSIRLSMFFIAFGGRSGHASRVHCPKARFLRRVDSAVCHRIFRGSVETGSIETGSERPIAGSQTRPRRPRATIPKFPF